MTNTPTQAKPAPVSETAKQAGEILARWAWVESAVWTERMLMAYFAKLGLFSLTTAHALAHQPAKAVNH